MRLDLACDKLMINAWTIVLYKKSFVDYYMRYFCLRGPLGPCDRPWDMWPQPRLWTILGLVDHPSSWDKPTGPADPDRPCYPNAITLWDVPETWETRHITIY